MKSRVYHLLRIGLVLGASSMLALAAGTGCAAVKQGLERSGPAESAIPSGGAPVTFTADAHQLGPTVRQIGEEFGVSLALMQGIEHLPAKSLELSRVPVSTAVQRLAAAGDCAVQITPHYYFLYPPGYEFLQEISLADKLDPAYHDVEGRMAFGAGTSLFNVFAWLSQGMGITVVADNAIASALCGELSLGTAPLAHGLEAVLKSARVIAFDVDSTEEFVFIYAAGRTPPRDFLLNPGPLDPDYDAILSRRISSLYLPEPPSDPTRMQYHPGATPLEEVLESLSRQLGIRVVAERQLEQLPVNPCVMHDVTVRTALNLLVRQWLAPGFGYQLSRDRIVIRAR